MHSVDLLGLHVESGTGLPVVLLQEQDEPHRVLPIFVGGNEAAAIARAATGKDAPRPMTHDLLTTMILALGGRVEAVEVTELRDGTFHARVLLDGPGGHQQVDSRPSDAIALALAHHAALYVSEAVLDEAGTTIVCPGRDESIDAEVDDFRCQLESLDPGAIAAELDMVDDADDADEEPDLG